ncbi:MAG TPA: cysteine desulfurase NifS [Candidatus Fimenecus excrementigallinarum]|uniref:Cysteine desulfurase IscS n=1 Tax=Candidatus Fimenecus excrementigallinarum TaxID=2840816 RepID=A0A9D1IG18_9FIRM|nr:cysteine desulfurase NifS [Candidatus Fimenecus excrementigallinarum]
MQVYADNAATTRLSETALQAMMPYLTDTFGNASSLYRIGQEAHKGVKFAHETVASVLNALPEEIFFTSGGSEADNWAIKGVAEALAKKGKKHIITSAFEHHAVLHTVEKLEKQGFEVTYLPVYANGIVRVDDVRAAIRPDTALVTVMYANNEIGTIQPIAEIGAVCREKGVLFHTDAVQAVGHVPIDVQAQNIDLLSMSAHKFHGPKGIGALYCRRGLRFPNLIEGGAQEKGRRAGTEAVYAMVGMAAALREASDHMEENMQKLTALRDRLIDGLLQVEACRLNGDRRARLPGNVNVSFEGVEGESLLLYLDAEGISASSGSACTSGSLDPSHVLLAIGLPHEVAHGSLRLTLCEQNTAEDVEYIIRCVPGIIKRLRDMSPLWERLQKERG